MQMPALFESEAVVRFLPAPIRRRVEAWVEHAGVILSVHNPRVMARLGPSAVRGLLLQQGRRPEPAAMPSGHEAVFQWRYTSDFPEMAALYQKAKRMQWNAAVDLDWSIDVDPLSPDVPILPDDFLAWDVLESAGIRPDAAERRQRLSDSMAWMLSQFLHGEQGALLAAAQVTECVPFQDGKLYGATQVVDEARHVEVFHRYLETKLNKLYVINDNLFTIIDSLMRDKRWDMKFLGMQIMVEGLALGAFGTLYKTTKEPLLKQLLRRVIHDEARHVHYGVLALREHFTKQLTERERQEREDWSFEVAMLMRNRFLAHELYEEQYAGMLSRARWNEFMERSPGMTLFRTVMFSRLVPNLRDIGLLTPRIMPYYEKAGLARFFGGRSALDMDGEDLVQDRAA